MDNIRFVLILAFAFILLMLWEAWQIDYGPKPEVAEIDQAVAVDHGEELPRAVSGNENIEVEVEAKEAVQETVSSVPVIEAYADHIVHVKTDVLQFEIDTKGGTLRNLDLLDYPVQKPNPYVTKVRNMFGLAPEKKDTKPIRLFNSSDENLFLGQSGLISASGSSIAPNHHTELTAARDNYELQDDQNMLKIPLSWTDGNGLRVTKTYILKRGSYLLTLEQKISNNTNKAWTGRQYTQLLRKPYVDEKGNNFIRTYAGGAFYTDEEKYQKVDYDEMAENLNITSKGGWSGMVQHYFASAWIPPAAEENHFYTKELKNWRYVIGSYSDMTSVQPHSETVLTSRLYAGPKIQPVMEAIAPGLELTVDYGWLTFIGKPIFWLLNKIHTLVGNWGLAIIGITLCIKALFFKLSKASYMSMAKMRKIQPKLQQLKETYADDRQRFNTEMMAMYKREKVNPMGGCLPILVQIPVFISLYWVLIETVELRQAPFILWLTDLSVQDPFFVLPVLMGVTMKIQQSLNPAPIDPLQAKVIKMFPYVFTVFFLFFPAGLVLYWVVNNTLSFTQQWYITRKIEAGEST